jgi:hypothetical protein
MAGNLRGYNGAVWNNLPGATLDMRGDLSFVASGGTTPVFNNAGTVRKSFGNGSALTDFVFNNAGAVAVQAGTLVLSGSGRSTGTFGIDAGATLRFSGFNYLLTTGTIITGAGIAVSSSSGGVLVDDIVTIDNFENDNDGLTIARTGDLVITHAFNWVAGLLSGLGSLDIAAGAALNISGPQGKAVRGLTINNAGTATWTGTGDIVASQNVVFNNLASAVFDIQNNQSLILPAGEPPGSSVFNNAGTFRKSMGGGTTTIGVFFNNTGTVDIQSGTVDFTGGY